MTILLCMYSCIGDRQQQAGFTLLVKVPKGGVRSISQVDAKRTVRIADLLQTAG